jgi:hypothetical protein
LDYDFLANTGWSRVVCIVVMVVRTERWTVDRVSDAFSNTLDTAAEGVVLTLVVVIAHITLVLRGVDSSSSGGTLYSNFFRLRSGKISCVASKSRSGVFVVVTGSGTCDWDSAFTELTFG